MVKRADPFHSFGALTAVFVFMLFVDYPAILAIFGFFFSLPCFYYIVARPDYATTGRFVLLTYNLTCLYWFVFSIFLQGCSFVLKLQRASAKYLCCRCCLAQIRCSYCWCLVGCNSFPSLVAVRSQERAWSSLERLLIKHGLVV